MWGQNAVPARFASATEENCKIVGRSYHDVQHVLKAARNQPFCYETFIDQFIDYFVGRTYGSGSTGLKSGQTLVNLEEMDCVTLVENMLALALTARDMQEVSLGDSASFGRYIYYLNQLRYQDGDVGNKDRRYHYFTDGLQHMQSAGWAVDVANFNGQALQKDINFMSTHRRSYRGIKDWSLIEEREALISQGATYYYPLSKLAHYEQVAQTGDIVALVTAVEGLDVSHVGIIHVTDGVLKMSHASTTFEGVVLRQDLRVYLDHRTTITGLVVFRPVF